MCANKQWEIWEHSNADKDLNAATCYLKNQRAFFSNLRKVSIKVSAT